MGGQGARRVTARVLALALLTVVGARDLGVGGSRDVETRAFGSGTANLFSEASSSSAPRRALSQWVLPARLTVPSRSTLRLPWQTADPAVVSASMGSEDVFGGSLDDDGDKDDYVVEDDDGSLDKKHDSLPRPTDYDAADADYFAHKTDARITDPIERQLVRWYRETDELDGKTDGQEDTETGSDESAKAKMSSEKAKEKKESSETNERDGREKKGASSKHTTPAAEQLGWSIKGEEDDDEVVEEGQGEVFGPESRFREDAAESDSGESDDAEQESSQNTLATDLKKAGLPLYYAKPDKYHGSSAIYVPTDKATKTATDLETIERLFVTAEEAASDEADFLQWIDAQKNRDSKRSEALANSAESATQNELDEFKQEKREEMRDVLNDETDAAKGARFSTNKTRAEIITAARDAIAHTDKAPHSAVEKNVKTNVEAMLKEETDAAMLKEGDLVSAVNAIRGRDENIREEKSKLTETKTLPALGATPSTSSLGRKAGSDLLETAFRTASKSFHPDEELVVEKEEEKSAGYAEAFEREKGNRGSTRTGDGVSNGKQSGGKGKTGRTTGKRSVVSRRREKAVKDVSTAALAGQGHKFSSSKHEKAKSSSKSKVSSKLSSKKPRSTKPKTSSKPATASQEIEAAIRGLMILDRAQVGKIDNADARGGSGSTYFFAGDSDDFVKNGQEHRRQTAEEGWLRDERVGSRRARIIKVSSLGLVLAGIGFFAVRQRLLKDRDESMRLPQTVVRIPQSVATPTSGRSREKPPRRSSGGAQAETAALLPRK